MADFTYEKKVRIRDKIQKYVTNRDDLLYIKKLLMTYNNDLPITKNKNGYFIDILNLDPKTYVELTKFLDILDKKRAKLEEQMVTISESSKCDDFFVEQGDDTDVCTQKKLKYKNSENLLLKRAKYEEALKIHQAESTLELASRKESNGVFKKKVTNGSNKN
jgi:hypothetical protein